MRGSSRSNCKEVRHHARSGTVPCRSSDAISAVFQPPSTQEGVLYSSSLLLLNLHNTHSSQLFIMICLEGFSLSPFEYQLYPRNPLLCLLKPPCNLQMLELKRKHGGSYSNLIFDTSNKISEGETKKPRERLKLKC